MAFSAVILALHGLWGGAQLRPPAQAVRSPGVREGHPRLSGNPSQIRTLPCASLLQWEGRGGVISASQSQAPGGCSESLGGGTGPALPTSLCPRRVLGVEWTCARVDGVLPRWAGPPGGPRFCE